MLVRPLGLILSDVSGGGHNRGGDGWIAWMHHQASESKQDGKKKLLKIGPMRRNERLILRKYISARSTGNYYNAKRACSGGGLLVLCRHSYLRNNHSDQDHSVMRCFHCSDAPQIRETLHAWKPRRESLQEEFFRNRANPTCTSQYFRVGIGPVNCFLRYRFSSG